MLQIALDESYLTSIADEVRTLNGTSQKLTIPEITNNLNNFNIQADEQVGLISEIMLALEGKGIGNSNSSNLEYYTVTLPDYDDPFIFDGESIVYIDENNTIHVESITSLYNNRTRTINVLKNTFFCLCAPSGGGVSSNWEDEYNGETKTDYAKLYAAHIIIFYPTENGSLVLNNNVPM